MKYTPVSSTSQLLEGLLPPVLFLLFRMSPRVQPTASAETSPYPLPHHHTESPPGAASCVSSACVY